MIRPSPGNQATGISSELHQQDKTYGYAGSARRAVGTVLPALAAGFLNNIGGGSGRDGGAAEPAGGCTVCSFDGSKPTIRTQPDGAFISATCDKDVSSIKMASPAAATVVALFAQKDSANLFVSRNTPKGLSSAGLGADDESGFVDLRTADGKNKEIEPE
jgi:hypothetical protein